MSQQRNTVGSVVQVWELRGRDVVHQTVEVDRAVEIAADPQTVVWLQVTPEEAARIGSKLELHPRAIEEAVNRADGALAGGPRTKLERFPRSVLLYLYGAELEGDQALALRPVPLLITREAVIAVEQRDPIDMDELVEKWQQSPELLEHGIATLVYWMLDYVVDSYLNAVDALSDAVDEMEDDLFDESPSGISDPRSAQLRSFATRKSLVRLRRVVQPMRELVSGLMRQEDTSRPAVDGVLLPYYQDVYDHVLRVNDTIEGLRDLITTIYETRLSLNDYSLNTVTRQLAAWAAIIAVPTAVTGF